MKNFFSKVVFIFTAITAVCYAKDKQINAEKSTTSTTTTTTTTTQCEAPCSSWSVVEDEAPCNCVYNCSARINPTCGWDFNIYGDFLYWQARENHLAPMVHIQFSPSDGKDTEIVGQEFFDFDYHPGFKVGIGAGTERDNWTFNLEYTRFLKEASKSEAISSSDFLVTGTSQNYFQAQGAFIDSMPFTLYSFLAIGSNFGLFYRTFDAHWKLNFNTLDLVAGRSYFLGTKLTLNPFFGLRGGWINQRYNLTAIIPLSTGFFPRTPVADYSFYFIGKSDSWLIGPRIGFKSNWLLGAGFRIFGDAGAALVYQNFKIKIKNFIPAQNLLTVKVETDTSHREKSFNPTFDAALGLGWGSYFNNKRWHFDLSAGYEFQFFYAQNEILGERDFTVDTESLILHGLTLSAKIDF